MIVSGPTSCGKTHFVKEMLRNSLVSPLPARIVWLYKRWQPLYDEIRKSMVVEFIKGIPVDLESDQFFDPGTRNLIVLDDLMSTAAKDPRINDLFTEGSHHRNLSVIAIKQSLFFGKDPTQRRNCHYLVLFNNPVDRQPISTLGRQMYPSRGDFLVRTFEEAVKTPYGHLIVDLKPTTPEAHRLRTDDLAKGVVSETRQEQSIEEIEDDDDDLENEYEDDLAACKSCGTVFLDGDKLLAHIERGCIEEPPPKRHKREG